MESTNIQSATPAPAPPPSPTPSPPPEKKKPMFETVVTYTPVLLTVIATCMVGQSSWEMTRAQYNRAMASQNQSKVGDQWAFFQAKRIRGQILEGNADVLLAQQAEPFSRDTFLDAGQGLLIELRRAKKALVVPANGDKSAGDSEVVKELTRLQRDLAALVEKADASLTIVKTTLNPPEPGGIRGKNLKTIITRENLQAALDALQPNPDAPKPEKKSRDKKDSKEAKDTQEVTYSTEGAEDKEQVELLEEIKGDIKKRKHETEIAPKVLKLKEETLTQAIKKAEAGADKVNKQGKAIENILEEFDVLVKRQMALTGEYHKMVARLKNLKAKNEADSPGKVQISPETRQALLQCRAALTSRAEAMRTLNARMQGDFKAARHAFTARRYENEARTNQESAYLYEIKVLLSSSLSDKHLNRSKLFLYAMLVAQGGVVIATLAMALKRKSVFWSLAALTGLIAIAFGVYVYLELGPMLGDTSAAIEK